MNWIDCTIPFTASANFSATPAKTLAQDGWNASTISLYSHAGTHMDAPKHFGVNEKGIDSYPTHRLMTMAWVVQIDISGRSQLLQPEDIGAVQQLLQPGDSLLLQTGWHKHAGTAYYRDALPRISEAFAQWMVEAKLNMLLVEPPSVADVNNLEEVTRIHKILLGADIIIVEGITTANLHGTKANIIALPLLWQGGDGAPTRVLAQPIEP